ncbi:Helix-turn-helix domain-containing protein [Hyphomicrobium sp. 1Nfss2.1]|uniref:helix-turn-helix domain-containing protein n=1 Tax=Hyphomicrobium sp. 1Nfss2.1 TaxID=3413936 RepID=UPI003C7C9A86
MPAHTAPIDVYEPTLPWPTGGRRGRDGSARVEPDAAAEWTSASVPRANQPLARVAGLLLSISQNNSYEGRDPEIVPDALTSGFVADLLGVDIGTLAALLVDLNHRGLIEGAPNSALRLKDVAGLERLSE